MLRFAATLAALAGSCLAAQPSPSVEGLVGHWTFDDGTGRDSSGAGNDLDLGGARIQGLGPGQACLQLEGDGQPARIPVRAGSPLAVARGTFCFWLNLGPKSSGTVLEFDNRAVQLNVYRSHFQPRFRGEGSFRFANVMLDDDWPKFELRESAFYPHEKAVTGEGVWHHFAVSYDDRARRIVGWRDGEQIAVVNLSTVAMQPLLREGLHAIATGDGFAGLIDELRIYDRALGGDDVRRIYEAERAAFAGRDDAVAASRSLHVYSYQESDRSLYRAWLQERPLAPSPSREILQRIAAPGTNPTVQNAARELAGALHEMIGRSEIVAEPDTRSQIVIGTPETSAWIRAHAAALALEAVRDDGYVLKTIHEKDATFIVIAARRPAGVVFGAFDLLRRLQLGADPRALDALENPGVPLRMVNHWDIWRGFPHDDWRGREEEADNEGNRSNSIYSWEELRRGDTRRVRDWARLLASAGWNAVCPTEINWEFRNNFLEHLPEVKTLAAIFREYGITLYWSPNYLLALRPDTADQLYAAVPDFGGYLLKLGSEAQEGDPRPAMVNRIADCLKPHGGQALVRAFVYGKNRYSTEDLRNLNPYAVIAPEDGHYRDNVVIISKGSPLDWDLSAPIPALDGAIAHNHYGSELVIAKAWPLSWVEKWKWWLEQDNYRRGPGTLNQQGLHTLLGVAMINPAPAWTACPLNMVNYYGLGRLGWNPDLTPEEIYDEWIRLTFGGDPDVVATIKTILLLSDDATRKLYTYRGYRGVWLDRRESRDLVQRKTPHAINPRGIGPATPALRERVLAQYAPGLRAIYGDADRGEEFFASFNFESLDHRLSSGRTVIQDVFANLDEGARLAADLARHWRGLEGRIDERQFRATLQSLDEFARTAGHERDATVKSFETATKRRYSEAMSALAPAQRAANRYFNVRDFGAKGDGTGRDDDAFNAAVAACADAGGGAVFASAGIYPVASLRLRSRVTLALDAGAVLRAIPHDAVTGTAMISGENLEQVKIIGPGMLDATAATSVRPAGGIVGDSIIVLRQCRDVVIRNVSFDLGGHTGILARDCTAVLVDNVTIHSAREGVDLQQCHDVTVTDCHIDSRPRLGGRLASATDPRPAVIVEQSEKVTVRHSALQSPAGRDAVEVHRSPAVEIDR